MFWVSEAREGGEATALCEVGEANVTQGDVLEILRVVLEHILLLSAHGMEQVRAEHWGSGSKDGISYDEDGDVVMAD